MPVLHNSSLWRTDLDRSAPTSSRGISKRGRQRKPRRELTNRVRELVRPYPQADRLITTAAQLLKNFADWLFPVPDINTIEHDQLTNEEDTISDDGGESVDDSDLEARVVPPTLDAMDMDASDTITTNDLGVPTIPSDQTQSAKQIIRLNTFIPNSSGTKTETRNKPESSLDANTSVSRPRSQAEGSRSRQSTMSNSRSSRGRSRSVEIPPKIVIDLTQDTDDESLRPKSLPTGALFREYMQKLYPKSFELGCLVRKEIPPEDTLEARRRRETYNRFLGEPSTIPVTATKQAPAQALPLWHAPLSDRVLSDGRDGEESSVVASNMQECISTLDDVQTDMVRLNEFQRRLRSSQFEQEIPAFVATHKELDLRKKKVLDRDLVAARKNAERIRRDMEKSIELDLKKLSVKALPTLPADAEDVIDYAYNRGPDTEKLSECGDITITRAYIKLLKGSDWLNDEIINAYMKLINKRSTEQKEHPRVLCHNTFFYEKLSNPKEGYDRVKRWTRKVDIFGLDYLIVPVHMGNHWCLGVINFKDKRLEYYDSLGGKNFEAIRYLRQYLELEHQDKKKSPYDTADWSVYCPGSKIPQQQNGFDCGVFLCTFAEHASRAAPFEFSQVDMPYCRKRITYELMKAALI